MYTSTILFVALFSRASQQLGDFNHEILLKQRHAIVEARQSGYDNSFCYGDTAICSEGIDLYSKCSAFEGQSDYTQWYQCLCGNGYIEASLECHWCNVAYSIPDADLTDLDISQCSKYNGGTIAPLPSSVLAAVSAFNASYTGVISGAATGGSGAVTTSTSGGEGSAVGSASGTARNTAASSKSASAISHSPTIVQTLNGGSPGSLTAAPTTGQGSVETSSPSTTLKSGSGTGGAQRQKAGFAIVFSMITVGLSILCML